MPLAEGILELDCPRCGTRLRFWRRKDLTTNAASLLFMDEGPLLDLYVCPECRHVECFAAGDDLPGEGIPGSVVKCPRCKKEHARSDDVCPLCGLPRAELEGLSGDSVSSPEPEPAPDPEKRLHYKGNRHDKNPWET